MEIAWKQYTGRNKISPLHGTLIRVRIYTPNNQMSILTMQDTNIASLLKLALLVRNFDKI